MKYDFFVGSEMQAALDSARKHELTPRSLDYIPTKLFPLYAIEVLKHPLLWDDEHFGGRMLLDDLIYKGGRTHLRPFSSGIYVISAGTDIYYVGQSQNLRERLHSNHAFIQKALGRLDSPLITWRYCDGVSEQERIAGETVLILKHRSIWNQQLNPIRRKLFEAFSKLKNAPLDRQAKVYIESVGVSGFFFLKGQPKNSLRANDMALNADLN